MKINSEFDEDYLPNQQLLITYGHGKKLKKWSKLLKNQIDQIIEYVTDKNELVTDTINYVKDINNEIIENEVKVEDKYHDRIVDLDIKSLNCFGIENAPSSIFQQMNEQQSSISSYIHTKNKFNDDKQYQVLSQYKLLNDKLTMIQASNETMQSNLNQLIKQREKLICENIQYESIERENQMLKFELKKCHPTLAFLQEEMEKLFN